WLDNALDAIATPAAVMAGMLVGAAVFTDLPPLLKWSLAIIAGGAAAGMVQGATGLLRLKSTALSGGLANPVLSTLELVGSFVMAVVAVMVPVVALLLAVALCVGAFRLAGRILFGRRGASEPSHPDKTLLA
ncbi:MAG: putative rane protein, partial [candidate division NC10 bacterium]|nr:putative rane protein [candidate division NC10 bacterium]